MPMRSLGALSLHLFLFKTIALRATTLKYGIRSTSRELWPALAMTTSATKKNIERRPVVLSQPRRAFIAGACTASCGHVMKPMVPAALAEALDDSSGMPQTSTNGKFKPRAPVETLIPATKVEKWIESCIQLTNDSSTENIDQLRRLLLDPPNFSEGVVLNVPQSPAKSYIDKYASNRANLNLLQQPGALLVQSGEILAWKRLKAQEQGKERQDDVRNALNMYTSNLNYNAQQYVLNLKGPDRSQMIRDEQLPEVRAVVESDLDMRYLYRNDVLSNIEDAQAELKYQLKRKPATITDDVGENGVDLTEVRQLLQSAADAMQKWIDLVDERDLTEARRRA